jgi:phytoene dehydrogenase-like protein
MNQSPDRDRYDAILIGGGHNSLVAAAYLGKAGYKVLVLERRTVLGGAAASEELIPGYLCDSGAFDAGLFLPEIAADLDLERYGLEWIEGPALVFAPLPGGDWLTLWRDPSRTQAEIARFSASDAEKYPDFIRQVSRLAGVLDSMRRLTPPRLPDYRYGELLPWLRTALELRRLGDREMMEFMRVLPMPVAEYLDEWFDTPALKGALGSTGVTGSLLGPRGSGSALMLLYQAMGAANGEPRASRFIRGGMGRLPDALASAARARGAEICTGLGVSRILLEGGTAIGVQLESGEKVLGKAVISGANPRHTFFELVGAPHLEIRFVRDVKNIRFRGSLARVTLALDGLPPFQGLDGSQSKAAEQLSGHILICPDLDYLERAYDDAKYGQLSAEPYLDTRLPTILDPSLAPPGKHLMQVNVQYAPFHLAEGDWDSKAESLGEKVISILERHAPGLRRLITAVHIQTPLDLERRLGLPEGDIYHGQMGLDQLLVLRPVPGSARYRTPVEQLFLCGAGSHPGGGVTGAPGYNAAREVIRFLRKT